MQAYLVRASEVKKVIEWIMDNLDGCYASGVINNSNLGYTEEIGGRLSLLSSSDIQKNASRAISVQGKAIELAVSPNATKNFRYICYPLSVLFVAVMNHELLHLPNFLWATTLYEWFTAVIFFSKIFLLCIESLM